MRLCLRPAAAPPTPADISAAAEEKLVRRDEWSSIGFQVPSATVQTLEWAKINGDTNVIANALAWADENSRAGVAAILLDTARRQFEEEIGFGPVGKFLPLGSIRQKGGKIVHAWAFQGDCADSFVVQSEPFEMEWPPRSGRILSFPEIDRGEFFPLPIARQKIKETQVRCWIGWKLCWTNPGKTPLTATAPRDKTAGWRC